MLWKHNLDDDYIITQITSDGRYIIIGERYKGKLCLFDTQGNLIWNFSTGNKWSGGDVYSISITPDGEYIAVGGGVYGGEEVLLFQRDRGIWKRSKENRKFN